MLLGLIVWFLCWPFLDSCVLSDLVTPLISILEDENSVAARCALTSLQLCLPSLLNSNHSDVGLSIILALLQLKDNTYWLVKAGIPSAFLDKYAFVIEI